MRVSGSLPDTPSNPSPGDGATGLATSVTLTWTASGATSHGVYFGTTNPPNFLASVSTPSITPSNYTPVQSNATYYWRINAQNSAGSTLGPVWSFTTAPATRALTVASTNPPSGVSVTVSPADKNGQSNGVTQFTRTYDNNTVVSLTAPAAASGNAFVKWQKDGVDWSTSTTTSVTMDANHTMTAVYTSNPVPVLSSLSPSSAVAGGAAFMLTVNGSSFVSTSVVRWNGADRTTTYVSSTQLTASISAGDIATAGTAQVTVFNPSPGGGTSNALTFTIGSSNPTPVLSSLSPTSAVAGGAAFTLTVNGSSFLSGSVVRWNGANRATTFVSSTQLTAAIPASDLATAGTAQVTVFNPSPGGGTSSALTFTISSNPAPTLNAISPTSATAGGAAFTLTVNGSSFVSTSVVRWNGADRTTAYVSSTQLTASIPASDIAAAGTAQVTVFNPSPGGGTSSALTFTISSNPAPVLSSLSPASAVAAGAAFTLTVNGSSFISTSVVRWNGADRTTTYVSSTQLTAAIPASDIATAGTAQVTVFNPTPGGGTSNALTFTISSVVVTKGTLSQGVAQGVPGGTVNIPITLSLNTGVSIDALSFGIQITPNGSAPTFPANPTPCTTTNAYLHFTKNTSLASPSFVDPCAGSNVISVAWLGNLSPALSGTVPLGEVVMSVPAAATEGQTYTVALTGTPSASLGTTSVPMAAGAAATVTVVTRTYLVGDAYPATADAVGQFGDEALEIRDLIYGLRAVTSVPGYRPPDCSDRFDAIDTFPVDTATTRGGDTQLGTVDLIITLRRVTGVDASRPRRTPRGLACPITGLQALARPPESEAAATESTRDDAEAAAVSLAVGAAEPAEGGVRVPVYLTTRQNVALAGLSFGLGAGGSPERAGAGRFTFEPAEVPAPTLVDNALPGILAVAWLNGLQVPAGRRVLLGYVEMDSPAPLQIYGVSADDSDGRPLRIPFDRGGRLRPGRALQ